MAVPTVLYELGSIVRDDLVSHAEELAEALTRDEFAIESALGQSASRYLRGEISQGQHWEDAAARLDVEDLDAFAMYAQHYAEADPELLGWIRGQQQYRLGLVSDATPDFVGHFRRELKLDRLFRVHVIGSELNTADYTSLLRTGAERLQAKPTDVWFVDRKPAHLEAARATGMQVIDLSSAGELRQAFAAIGR